MSSIIISADDPRTIRAIELAAEADHWLSGRNAAGEAIYGVPSQSEAGRYYIVTRSSCDCPDFRRREAARSRTAAAADDEAALCKHVLAVRLHEELLRAQEHRPAPPSEPSVTRRRGHLSLVPTERR